MSRTARLIDHHRLRKLKKQLRNSEYVYFAVQIIARNLTDRFFKEREDHQDQQR